MKALIGILIILMIAAAASAQDAKVIAELAASSEKLIKNSPFSAEAVSESVQTLADGNRIVRSSTSKLYRNSEGRFRRELSGSGELLGSSYNVGPGVTILDPVAGHRYLLDPNLKTIRQGLLRPTTDVKVLRELSITDLQKQYNAAKVAAAELRALAPVAVVTAAPEVEVTGVVSIAGSNVAVLRPGVSSKYESRTEQLGSRNVEGVEAEGTRTVTTIPANAIGNERPIEIVYEKWYSKELGLVVMSKHNDPRFGEQTYRLTNIVRTEPDPSLFTLPTGYRVLGDAPAIYHVTPAARARAERAAVAAAPAVSVTVAAPVAPAAPAPPKPQK